MPRNDEELRESGYVVHPRVVPAVQIDALLERFVELVNETAGTAFTDPHGTDLVDFFNEHLDVEGQVYVSIRDHPWLRDLCLAPSVTAPVASLLGRDCELLGKIVFRIDLPHWTTELAVWHQDFHYVRGNTSIMTAWIPLQDTTYRNGCLSVMPASHLLGSLPHDLPVGKRHMPSGVFDREIRLVELQKGDLLLFDSLLLHSSNVNLSDSIRYSVQARYSPAGQEIDRGMGSVIAVDPAATT